MTETARTMLSFLSGKQRFNYRVAGIALRDNHLLVCREDDDDYVMLPGGRVEFGETSDLALRREIGEELKCSGTVGAHLFTAENFYHRDDEVFHEIGMYYAMTLDDAFPFTTDGPCLVTQDEGHDLHFSWILVDPMTLDRHRLHPKWLHGHLASPLKGHHHVKVDERCLADR